MELPALRQPKFVRQTQSQIDIDYIILTLKNEMKLVVASDAYHGIITADKTYRCVFCDMSMDLDTKCRDIHKDSHKHKGTMSEVPYIEEFAEHLVRKLNKEHSYCTICNVTLPSYSTARHIVTESHSLEYERAVARALSYKPFV